MRSSLEQNQSTDKKRRPLSFRLMVILALSLVCVCGMVVLHSQTARVFDPCHYEKYQYWHAMAADTANRHNGTEQLQRRQDQALNDLTLPKLLAPTAQDIVQRSFQDTYAKLQCSPNVFLRDCLDDLYSNTLANNTFPWWFRTLLRDSKSPGSGLYGSWHNLRADNKNGERVQMCTMDKVATSQWRKVFCTLYRTSMTPKNCGKLYNNQTIASSNKTVGSFVFVRDPLERFLSAFLDKCVGPRSKREPHCQPSVVFLNQNGDIMQDIKGDSKLFFETYVDTMPLRWNSHFMPMGLNCNGLYRFLDTYNVVGQMGPNFYSDLERVAGAVGVVQQVDAVFNVTFQLKNDSSKNVGVETMAASRVLEYYTPKTVKRVLEYLSLDYMTLNLPIPVWAEEMIQQEQEQA